MLRNIIDMDTWLGTILGKIEGATEEFQNAIDDRSRSGIVQTVVIAILWRFGGGSGIRFHLLYLVTACNGFGKSGKLQVGKI